MMVAVVYLHSDGGVEDNAAVVAAKQKMMMEVIVVVVGDGGNFVHSLIHDEPSLRLVPPHTYSYHQELVSFVFSLPTENRCGKAVTTSQIRRNKNRKGQGRTLSL